jgi:hypothetical protein
MEPMAGIALSDIDFTLDSIDYFALIKKFVPL